MQQGEKLENVAQLCMDAFYQEYKPDDAFLELVHFSMLCRAADNKLKMLEFKEQLNLKIRMRIINSLIQLSPDNYFSEDLKVEKDGSVKLKHSIMSFSGDDSSVGVSVVEPIGNGGCSPFIRTTINEKWQVCKISDVVFWYPMNDKIHLINIDKVCKVDKVRVVYIPSADDEMIVNQSRVWDITNMVSKYIVDMKNGNVVDMSSDGNPNTVIQTEINKYLYKQLNK